MSRPKSCAHGITADHSAEVAGVRVWRCSSCARTGPWGEGWIYSGTIIECPRCWHPEVNEVLCPDCSPGVELLPKWAPKARKC